MKKLLTILMTMLSLTAMGQERMGPKAQAAAAAGVTEAVIDETAREGRHPQSDAFLNEWEMRVREPGR